MLKASLVAIALATAVAAVPASAQQDQPPAASVGADLIGLPVYSSDGEKLGEVTDAATRGGRTAVRAEMGAFLGLGPSAILVDADMFLRKGDRVEVTLTAAEVRARLSRQKPSPSQ